MNHDSMNLDSANHNSVNYKKPRIGVWGYGVVGKSAITYLKKESCTISLFDYKELSPVVQDELHAQGVTIYQPTQLTEFLEQNDNIIPSPGIDLRANQKYAHKFISEFDLLRKHWYKPLIGITGTVGKTTITQFLSQLLPAAGKRVATGGNIGTGMLDLIEQQPNVDCALLELSSFQLELCKTGAPDLAIITNIYQNHLDRHGSFEAYRAAKFRIVTLQQNGHRALLPLALAQHFAANGHQNITYFCDHVPSTEAETAAAGTRDIFYLAGTTITHYHHGTHEQCIDIAELESTYPTNWLIIYAALKLLGISWNSVTHELANLQLPHHRLACIAQWNTIQFYNDSKSTVAQATIAALQKLRHAPTIVFIGGISKGVDRTSLIDQLHGLAKHAVCFGKEAEMLQATCIARGITASSHTTLESAFSYCMETVAQPHDQILFSPAGASFDLFTNYEHRGEQFEALVKQFIAHNTTVKAQP